MIFFFFFQAEDGIRDLTVTGVQTCALPISGGSAAGSVAIALSVRRPRNSKRANRNARGSPMSVAAMTEPTETMSVETTASRSAGLAKNSFHARAPSASDPAMTDTFG